MPACPNCGDVLTSAEWKTGNCPMCGASVGWTRGPHTDEFIAEPHKIAIAAKDRPGWGTVRAGLGLLIVSTILIWSCTAALVLAYPIFRESGDGESLASAGALTMRAVTALTLFASVFIALAGMAMCTGVPAASRGRIWIISCVVGMFIMFAAVIDVIHMTNSNSLAEMQSFSSFEEDGSEEFGSPYKPPYTNDAIENRNHAGKIIGLVSQNLFLFFLWSLARFTKQKRLVISTIGLLGASLCYSAGLAFYLWNDNEIGLIQQLSKFGAGIADVRTTFIVLAVVIIVWFVATLMLIRRQITKLLREEYL